ncbi:hypothetical protein JZ751_008624, partial [Albula glossodonta]
SLFARKVKEPRPLEQREPGWKLFGKVPLREVSAKDPQKIQKLMTPLGLHSLIQREKKLHHMGQAPGITS